MHDRSNNSSTAHSRGNGSPVTRRTLLAGALTTASAAAFASPAASAPASPTAALAEPVRLGQPLKDVNLIGAAVTTTPDGRPVVYGVIIGDPATLAATDANTHEVLWTQPLANSGGSYSVQVYPNGDVYVAAYSQGRLYRKAWGSDTIEDLGQPLPGQTFLWDITIGPDGRIYGVTYPGAMLYAYDPATGDVQDYGRLVTDTQQARTITAHDGKLYIGTMTPAHFLEVEPASGDVREIPLPDGARPDDPQSSIFDVDVSGGRFYVRVGTDIKHAPVFGYDLASETWYEPITQVAGLSLPEPGPDGEIYMMRENVLTAYHPDSGELAETSLVYPGRVYNYRGVGWVELDDPAWPGKTLTGYFWRGEAWRFNPATGESRIVQTDVPGEPIEVLSLAPAADGGVWAGGYLGGFAHVDVDDGTADFHRWSQTESILDEGSEVWLGAYPDARGYRYDPDAEFNDPDYNPGPPGTDVNPVKLWDFSSYDGGPQDRVFALARSGSLTFAATGPKRSAFGGTLTIYDDKSGDVVIREGLAPERAFTSLTVRRGVLYASSWVNGGTGTSEPPQSEGTVLAYDPKKDRVLWQVSPLDGAPSYVGVVFDPQGRLWTLAGTTLLRLNPHTGQVTAQIELPGDVDTSGMTFPSLAGGVQRVPGASALYVNVARRLFRVRTTNGHVADLGEFPYRLVTVVDDGRLVMSSGATLYRTEVTD
ncbi:PQQ-binding-like beta-propeller repeat protein [Phytoactinopolyspora halotolerans]|uniref:PQQ-binding-like beta-propeller repeat protein n=1 Tax=Phytoactinopolyspora halotolerans TaxID=1981512 RepID=A0A6L9S1Q3_9ACTN|nr:PQQ-binding-like beta-propeller repeat protein [Phytoactinopolyspora halotolerans]NED98992.1 PQQ-binding-like beta-propeller repeat protein [Phytoactinopolyspora halotolerans]